MSTEPDRPLKVCHATWAPFVGGAEVAAERLAVGLREAGHEVFSCSARPGPFSIEWRRPGFDIPSPECGLPVHGITHRMPWPGED